MSEPPATTDGWRFGGFTAHSVIGRGGMGEVWSGVHDATRVPVAIKVITRDGLRAPDALATFHEEVRTMASMSHPGIVRVFDYGVLPASAGDVGGSPFVVMERASGTLPFPESWPALEANLHALLRALAHIHARGVVHRDLKPSNILILGDGSHAHRIALADFGIAWHTGPAESPEQVAGTPAYMAPEQHRIALTALGPWTDLYTFGVVAWELASGRRPFVGEHQSELANLHCYGPRPPVIPQFDIPAGFDAWVSRLMAPAPGDRYQCAADAAAALAGLGPIVARPAPKRTVASAVPMTLTQGSTIGRTLDATQTDTFEVEQPAATCEPMAPDPTTPARPMPADWRDDGRMIWSPALLAAGQGLLGLAEAPMTGREPERDALWAALARTAASNHPELVILSGGPGLGKSRLGHWLTRRAAELGLVETWPIGHEPELTPRSGLAASIRNLLGVGRWLEPDRALVLDRARAQVGDEHAAVLAHLVRPSREVPHDLESRHTALTALTAALSSRRPLVLWLDDAQWAEETLSWLTAGALAGPVLVVATVRSDLIDERPDAKRLLGTLETTTPTTRLPLKPLDAGDQRALARELLGLDDRVADRLVARSGGHPLLLQWLLDRWVRSGALVPTPAGYALNLDIETTPALPESWVDRVRTAVADLPTSAGHWLELIAALGARVSLEELDLAAGAAGLTKPPQSALDALVRRGLMRPGRGDAELSHDLIRAAVESIARTEGRWTRFNRACADVIERRYAPGAPGRAERLGRHAAMAGEWERALEPLVAGAAERFLTSEYAAAHTLLTLHDDACDALGLPENAPARRAGLNERLGCYHMQGEFDALERIARQLLAGSPPPNDEPAADAGIALGWLLTVFHLRPDEAAEQVERSLSIFDARHDDSGVGRCALMLGGIGRRTGDEQQMKHWAAVARERFIACDDHRGICAALHSLADAARRSGEAAEALELLDDAHEYAREHPFDVPRLELLRGHILAERGDTDGARRAYEHAIATGVRVRVLDQVQEARIGLAVLLLTTFETTRGESTGDRTLLARCRALLQTVRSEPNQTATLAGQTTAAELRQAVAADDTAAADAARAALSAWRETYPYVDPEVDRYLAPLAGLDQ